MLRHSYGNRPFHNETCLYGWGYNGTLGPLEGEYPKEYHGDSLDANEAGQFWLYSKTIQDGSYMGAGADWVAAQPLNSYGHVVFGGLGIGIDFPLYLTDEDLIDKNATTMFRDANGPPLTVVRSHVPIPVRLDDYDASGERLGRENWVKLQGGTGECLGIKSSGNTLHDSGHLYGWGMGSYNGGSSVHSSMRFWSCVPEICDSGSSRFLPDSLHDNPSNTPPLYKTYLSDFSSHIVSEPYGDDHLSPNWIDIACATRHDATQSYKPPKKYSWYLGIKDGKLYTWGYQPFGKGLEWSMESKYRMGRVFKVADTPPTSDDGPPSIGTISATQPTFTKCFGGVGGAAAIDSDGKLYFMGKSDILSQGTSWGGLQTVGTYWLPTPMSTADGVDGFSWWDSGYWDMVVVQDGNVWHATRDISSFGKKHYSTWASDLFSKLDDSVSAGSTLPTPNTWTQAYTLTKDIWVGSDGPGHTPAAIVALNASGQIWIRNPEVAVESTTPATASYRHLAEADYGLGDGDISAWSQISPTGVTFTKIILNGAHGGDNDKMYQIMGLTDKGELYTTDNTRHNTFPYVDYASNPDGWNAAHFEGGKVWLSGTDLGIKHYCPLNPDGSLDQSYTNFTNLQLLNWVNQERYTSAGGWPYTFTKVKPLTDNGDGAWWDQKDQYCFVDLGWPIGHPKNNTTYGKYNWALEYKEVDGSQSLSFPPVENRTNTRLGFDRQPPVLMWSSPYVDPSSDNPNMQKGLIDKGRGYTPHKQGFIGDDEEGDSRAPSGFGKSVATNEDGSIVAVAAPHYPDYNSGPVNKGAVYIYRVVGEQYIQLGNTIVWVGEQGDEAGNLEALCISNHTGTEDNLESIVVAIGSRTADRPKSGGGALGITRTFNYSKSTSTWSQMGADVTGTTYPTALTGGGKTVGCSLSDDGLTLAVGHFRHHNHGTPPWASGRVEVYTWSGSAWVLKGAPIDAGVDKYDGAGWKCQLSDDGNVIAISCTNDVWHQFKNKGAHGKGHVRVYEYNGGWTQKGQTLWGSYHTSGPNAGSQRGTGFSHSVAINGAGDTLIVGEQDFNATYDGINSSYGTLGWGRAHIYTYSYSQGWVLFQTFENPDYPNQPTRFGHVVSIDRSGDTIAVGAYRSKPTVLDGGASRLGQTFVYKRPTVGEDYILINRHHDSDPSQDMTTVSETKAGRNMGHGVALSRDGLVFVAGVPAVGGPYPNGTGARAVIRKLMDSNFLYPTMNFRHPRRQLSPSRDFLWDGQDAHTFTDGWEDLTTARWAANRYNKYWGIR